MGIDVIWDDDQQTIIRWEFGREWSRIDFREAFNRTRMMAKSVEYRVDVIPYIRHTPTTPPGLMSEFSHIDRYIAPNIGLIVVTGGNTFGRMLIDAFRRTYSADNWLNADTLDDARHIIRQSRQ